MKKTLSVVLALAMVLVMCIPAFAAEKPADPADEAAWTAYYTEVLADEEADSIDLAGIVVKDVLSGAVDANVAVNAVESAALAIGTDAAMDAVEAVMDILGVDFAPELPDVLPEDEEKNPTLATIEEILDAIFGFISEIAGSLFKGNGADDYCLFPTEPETTEPPMPEEPVIDEVPPLGDNSIIAVGAVALVAGAALVLTRKKDKDAE